MNSTVIFSLTTGNDLKASRKRELPAWTWAVNLMVTAGQNGLFFHICHVDERDAMSLRVSMGLPGAKAMRVQRFLSTHLQQQSQSTETNTHQHTEIWIEQQVKAQGALGSGPQTTE